MSSTRLSYLGPTRATGKEVRDNHEVLHLACLLQPTTTFLFHKTRRILIWNETAVCLLCFCTDISKLITSTYGSFCWNRSHIYIRFAAFVKDPSCTQASMSFSFPFHIRLLPITHTANNALFFAMARMPLKPLGNSLHENANEVMIPGASYCILHAGYRFDDRLARRKLSFSHPNKQI